MGFAKVKASFDGLIGRLPFSRAASCGKESP